MITKHIRVKELCSVCNHKLKNSFLIIELEDDFTNSEISSKIQETNQGSTCKKHPNAKTLLKYSYYHEQKI
ncbi:hypothetical protein [Tenacibaculum sp. nBUS_03]|uniref:hypothetical protein n=1 Tax=Tenacibaculum sp. nBUS_03 TaxID=3395320 RepID=UPI003EBE6D54